MAFRIIAFHGGNLIQDENMWTPNNRQTHREFMKLPSAYFNGAIEYSRQIFTIISC